jgi:hypothetical protein
VNQVSPIQLFQDKTTGIHLSNIPIGRNAIDTCSLKLPIILFWSLQGNNYSDDNHFTSSKNIRGATIKTVKNKKREFTRSSESLLYYSKTTKLRVSWVD